MGDNSAAAAGIAASTTVAAITAFAESPLGQALLEPRPRVADGLQQAVEIVDELRGGEQRNPLLLPEPWRYMLSTLTATPS